MEQIVYQMGTTKVHDKENKVLRGKKKNKKGN
jgi:hypothetical protein